VVCLLASSNAKQDAPAAPPIDRTAELNVKAVYVYSICKFVTWPAEVLPAEGKPLVIGVLEKPDIVKPLNTIAGKRKANNHTLEVRKLNAAREAGECHVVVVGSTFKADEQTALIKQLAGKPVVIIAETAGMGQQGAQFNFFLTPNLEVHFEVNVKAAKESHLEIDPQVTSLKFIRLLR
jgi:hypothetical protein